MPHLERQHVLLQPTVKVQQALVSRRLLQQLNELRTVQALAALQAGGSRGPVSRSSSVAMRQRLACSSRHGCG